MRSMLVDQCYKSIDQLKFLPQEKEMLLYKLRLEQDPETKQQYDEEMAKPLPKLDWQRIDVHSFPINSNFRARSLPMKSSRRTYKKWPRCASTTLQSTSNDSKTRAGPTNHGPSSKFQKPYRATSTQTGSTPKQISYPKFSSQTTHSRL